MIKQLLLLIMSFILTMVVLELFIVNAKISNVSPNEFYDDIGRGRKANLNYVYFNEGFGIGSFNEYRYLGKPHSENYKNNNFRIILLGDSYVESFQIFERHHFVETAKEELHKKFTNVNFEILNLGRSGFDFADMYAYHQLFANKIKPNLIFYFISNEDLQPKYSDPLSRANSYFLILNVINKQILLNH